MILAISGSLRRSSINSAVLRAAAKAAARDGLIVRIDDSLRRLAVPEYAFGIPGAFKNALDWASRPFPDNCLRGKPVAVVGASTGLFGAVWAQAELRKVLKTIGASVLETDLPVATAHDAFTADGRLREPRLAMTLCGIVGELVHRTLRDAA